MWFADLSPWSYAYDDPKLVAVGWLQRDKPFATGDVDRRVFDALRDMRNDPWQPFASGGFHTCDLCRFDGEARTSNLFIPDNDVIYVCPELVVHYMNAHGYAPPQVFCDAVLACPPMKSMDYLRRIVSSGATSLLRPPGGDTEPL